MMKDVDNICRHIDPLIHRYLVNASTSKDILSRSFAYNFDFFSRCSNPRHVSQVDIPLIPTLYPLFPLLWCFIITQFGSLPKCNIYSPHHLLHHYRVF